MNPKLDILDIASKLGQGKRSLEIYNQILEFPVKPEFDIDEEIKHYEIDDKKGNILYPLIRGHWGLVSYRAGIISHAFRTRGYEPIVPLCDADLQVCHRMSPENERQSTCDLCNFYGIKLLDDFGITPLSISDIPTTDQTFSPDSADERIEYRDVLVSKYARSSSRKQLRKYNLDLSDGYEYDVYSRFLHGAAKHVDICKWILDDMDINAVIGSDSVYNVSGIYLEVARENGISTYSEATGYRDGHVIYGRQDSTKPHPYPQFTERDVVTDYMVQPLDQTEMDEVTRIMDKRSSGESSSVPAVSGRESLNLEHWDTVAGMFTNLIWDGSLEVETAPYPDVFEWIFETINKFIGTDNGLIIRTHPVEALRKTEEGVADSIRDHYDELPDNIVLVDPDDDVNTYELMDHLDVGIVYNSTVGLEMAYNGIPVIVGGNTHYRNMGFTYDPDTPNEYRNYLSKIGGLDTKDNTTKLAQRYIHFLFVKKHISFPFYSTDSSVSTDLSPVFHEDIIPGNENFDLIVKAIINDNPVISE